MLKVNSKRLTNVQKTNFHLGKIIFILGKIVLSSKGGKKIYLLTRIGFTTPSINIYTFCGFSQTKKFEAIMLKQGMEIWLSKLLNYLGLYSVQSMTIDVSTIP